MNIPRRSVLTFFVRAPLALATLATLGAGDESGAPAAPITLPAAADGQTVEMTFREEVEMIDVTAWGDVVRRYASGPSEVTESRYRAALDAIVKDQAPA